MLDISLKMLDISDVGQNVQHFAGGISVVIWWGPLQQNRVIFSKNQFKLLLSKLEHVSE